jgi:hypothetical protein
MVFALFEIVNPGSDRAHSEESAARSQPPRWNPDPAFTE